MNAGEAALLATFGYNEVNVYRRPTAAIFATGSELLPVNEPLQPGKIRNSNSYMLAAQVQSAGGVPRILEMVPDDVELAMEKIVGAFDKVDVVITTGGVSVGDYDILVDIFQKWDGELLFNKVAMRPGSPTSVGIRNGQFLFGLPAIPGLASSVLSCLCVPCCGECKEKNNGTCRNDRHGSSETTQSLLDFSASCAARVSRKADSCLRNRWELISRGSFPPLKMPIASSSSRREAKGCPTEKS